MSVSQWWMHLLIPEGGHHRLRASVMEALLRSVGAEVPTEGLDAVVAAEGAPSIDRRPLVRYHTAFNLPAFAELGTTIMQGMDGIVIDESTMAQFVVTKNITPVSILYFALGPEQFLRLPGRLGNSFVTKDEVAAALRDVRATIEATDRKQLIARGTALYRIDHYPCENEVAGIVDAWPAALALAAQRGTGLLSLGMQAP